MRYERTNLSQWSLFWHHEALPSIAKQWPEGRFVYLYPTIMIDSTFAHFFMQTLELITFYLKLRPHLRPPFCFDVVLWRSCDVRKRPSNVTSITTNVCKGWGHQNQTSISDPDQNLGFTSIFSSGVQEYIVIPQQNVVSVYVWVWRGVGDFSLSVILWNSDSVILSTF